MTDTFGASVWPDCSTMQRILFQHPGQDPFSNLNRRQQRELRKTQKSFRYLCWLFLEACQSSPLPLFPPVKHLRISIRGQSATLDSRPDPCEFVEFASFCALCTLSRLIKFAV